MRRKRAWIMVSVRIDVDAGEGRVDSDNWFVFGSWE